MNEDEEPTQVDPTHSHDHLRESGGDLLEDERLGPIAAELRALYLVPPSADVEHQHLARMFAAVAPMADADVVPLARRRRRRGLIAGAVVAATLAGSVGLAAAGVLPGPLQNGVAAALRPLGLHLETDRTQSPGAGDPAPATTSTTSVSTPGGSSDAPGQGGANPGNSAEAPGQQTDPGGSEDAPGQGGENPGKSDEAPGRSGENPGKSDEAPGHGGENPGKSDQAPGQGGENPGRVATTTVPTTKVPPTPPTPPTPPSPTPSTTVALPPSVPPTTPRVPPSTGPDKEKATKP